MFNRQFSVAVAAVFAMLITMSFTNLALASGGSGGGSGGGYSGNYGSYTPPRKVDHNYEYGKAIYQGRKGNHVKYAYCVDVDGEKVPAKRKTLKQFKNSTYADFANALFNCDEPSTLIGHQVGSEKFEYVLYYLNKRYKLALR